MTLDEMAEERRSLPSGPARLMTPLERFEFYVHKTTSCWLWRGVQRGRGNPNKRYGVISIKGKSISAHRWAYSHFVAPIPNGMLVCHRCDTPLCVNPAHLFLGTGGDNMRDMALKRRHYSQTHPKEAIQRAQHMQKYAPRGQRHWNAKLNEDGAKLVLELLKAGTPVKNIAAKLGVSRQLISDIKRGLTWKHIRKIREGK
jgi:hypothetical protein